MMTTILIGTAFATTLMGLLWWLHQLGRSKAGMVDAAWALGVAAIGVFFALTADGNGERKQLVALIIGLWGLRLGLMLLFRVLRLPEDGRYVRMIEAFGENARRNLFFFHLLQASWIVLFALSPLFAASAGYHPIGMWDQIGLAIAALAVLGEGLADRQLAHFREQPKNKGKVCNVGLWNWSRHPNYFFEWVFWWSFVAIGWNGPYGIWTLLGPAIMFAFLYRVTGIPFTEQQALRSRGEAYREYQRTTSAFFPWPPRRSPPSAGS
ncbi:MAG TPA: DUF1295 domain-containing protein [Planctomycetota bacterium]|nr:DUF1295 domain-containing protein [Planctomycetota bacterium]